MLDTRREALHIEREFNRYHQKIGESVVWFRFDTQASEYSALYDEGGRAYQSGILVPLLWVDQIEAPEQYTPEGRRPYQSLRFAVSAKAMYEVGIGDREAHGHRVWDAGVIKDTWLDDRLNDICYYNGRYYEIMNFQIRGRIREDVIIGVTCTEIYVEDERVFDFPSGVSPPIPPEPPEPITYGAGEYGDGPYGG
jgi:hypothetical protein